MIRKGELPADDPNWTEVPYMDEKGFCSVCKVTHRLNSTIGVDHSTAVMWRNKKPLPTVNEVLESMFNANSITD